MSVRYEKSFVIIVTEIPAGDNDLAGYVATNDELGLVVEADSLDALKHKVLEVAQDLFELNVLPSLRDEIASMPPAFVIQHALGGRDGGDILS